MTMFTRRSLLTAISATALVACGPNVRGSDQKLMIARGLDAGSVDAIAKSYAASTGDVSGSKIEEFMKASGEINLPAVKSAIAEDFKLGRMFVHAGWHLSHTEGQLFMLLSRTP